MTSCNGDRRLGMARGGNRAPRPPAVPARAVILSAVNGSQPLRLEDRQRAQRRDRVGPDVGKPNRRRTADGREDEAGRAAARGWAGRPNDVPLSRHGNARSARTVVFGYGRTCRRRPETGRVAPVVSETRGEPRGGGTGPFAARLASGLRPDRGGMPRLRCSRVQERSRVGERIGARCTVQNEEADSRVRFLVLDSPICNLRPHRVSRRWRRRGAGPCSGRA
jgi:hypothetical protein